MKEKGFAHVLVVLLLLAGIGVAAYLVQQQTNLFPKAAGLKRGVSAPIPPPFTCTPCAADIKKDASNQVNISDFGVLSACFNKSPETILSNGTSCSVADINQDGSINLSDFNCLRSVYLKTCTASPSASPSPTAKRVFVTSTTYNGNLGGLSGADSKCQVRANVAGLGGTWKAWLSDGRTSATSRLTHNSGPYKLVNGTVIANNWTDLTDGTLSKPISRTEFDVVLENVVWTNTSARGDVLGGYSCDGWTLATEPGFGAIGVSSATTTDWSFDRSLETMSCTAGAHLYCFEQ